MIVQFGTKNWKSVTPLLLNFGFTPFHMAWLNSLHNCSTRVCWWCQLSYHVQIILIHMVTWILAFSLYLDIVYKYELERLLPIISWEKISINHLAFDFNNIDIWSDIWMFTLGWNLTKSAFGLSIEFRHLAYDGTWVWTSVNISELLQYPVRCPVCNNHTL